MSTDAALDTTAGIFLSQATAPAAKPKKHHKKSGHPHPEHGSPEMEPSSDENLSDEHLHQTQPPVRGAVPPAASEEYDPHAPFKSGTDWLVVGWIGLIHVFALGALLPYFFSWQALVFTLVTTWFSASFGICVGYHRLLTHNSFQTYKPVRWFLALLGSLTGEGPALTWVANHRLHHQFSDKDGDPHSPRDGGLWSHMLWFMPNQGSKWKHGIYQKYAPDLYKDPVMRFLEKTFILWHFVTGLAIFFGAYAIWGDWQMAASFLIWGVFVRMVYTLHVTWFVNSATHKWGYQNYKTSDDSTNLWWVGLLAFGEGWHNNHHAYQRMARHGHKWWEIDVSYWAILFMEKTGLAWNVVKEPPKHGKPA
jgi:fatty-acid desaturase